MEPSGTKALGLATLGFCAIAFATVGLAFVVAPAKMAALIDIELVSATARNDLRAVYGGLDLGIGAFLLASLFRPGWRQPALALATLTFGCLLGVRVVDWLLDGGFAGLTIVLGSIELACLVLAGLAWHQSASTDTANAQRGVAS